MEELASKASLSDEDVIGLRNSVSCLDLKPIEFPLNKTKIGYIPLIESSQFTLCVFYLPKGSVLPFHDHPRQYVGLRVLRGELELESCDVQSPGRFTVGQKYEIARSETKILTSESEVLVVKPDLNNIHEIRSKTEAMFVDYVVPPYGPDRAITYFSREADSLTALRERDVDLPMEFHSIHSLVTSR